MKYSIIIPAHNEEVHLKNALSSVRRQTHQPISVIVVNDNSDDATESIIDEFAATDSNIHKLNIVSSHLHMPGSKVVNAFNSGLEQLRADYDFIVKMDADIILPDDYFEKIATIFKNHPNVGIAGGFAYEQDETGIWKRNHPMDNDHVRGAFKSYRKNCFHAMAGLRNAMGWDTVDELLAKFHGFDIHTDESLKVKHLRPIGKAYNKKAKLLQGKAMYTMRYGFAITLIASSKMAWKQGKFKSLLDNLRGYFSAKKERAPFLVTETEGEFIRALRWKNIKNKLLK
ncbi:glycosyltransferase family 2 protein [Sediminicola sp. 1XM1-17]|uniref:glycosyltransferase family 2 protein n=1 Tax=Sediminicola sp. 1XM1-17 TaxID=3127702 RepID=UPI003077A6DC